MEKRPSLPLLKVLIVDPVSSSAEILRETMESMSNAVWSVKIADDLSEARNRLAENYINTIYIDPIRLGLESATQFIFSTRRSLSHIVFVLYVDIARMECMEDLFRVEKRSRFKHYHKLDKDTPPEEFARKVKSTVIGCQEYLSRVGNAEEDETADGRTVFNGREEAKETDKEKITIQATELLNAIRKGQNIDIESAVIEGNLDIGEPELEGSDATEIKGKVYIRYSEFKGNVCFIRTRFLQDVSFLGTSFTKIACFGKAHFSMDAFFDEARFNDNAYFNGANFNGKVYFTEASALTT